MKPIKVLHVFGTLNCGGAEMRTLEVLSRLDRRRYDLHFCALSGRVGDLEGAILKAGGKTQHVRVRGPGFSRRFRELLRTEAYDVVHSHVHYFSGAVLRLAAQCGVPVRIVYFQSSQDGRGRNPWRQVYSGLMRRWINRYATDILAVSEGALSAAWRPDWQNDPRCQVIYQGVEVSRFKNADDSRSVRRRLGVADDAPLYIHVGRITAAKNHERLVEIFAAVRNRQPRARLLVVGRGDKALEAQLLQQIISLGLDEAVVMCGERDDIPRLLAAADVMIFPSRWEGLPGAVLEACASGMPVVASSLPSIGEIAERVRTVQCVSLESPNEEWAAAIESAFQARHGRAEAARLFAASELTVESLARRTCRVWARCRETRGVAA